MSITDDIDDSIIAAVQRWHIFNRDPSDQHWQNIDSLLHKIDNCKSEVDEAVKDEKAYWERETGDLEKKLDDMTAERDAEIRRAERLESQIEAQGEEARTAMHKMATAAEDLDKARVDYALKLEKKLMAMTRFCENVARQRDGEAGVTKIRAIIEAL